jgi:hypothetical protein
MRLFVLLIIIISFVGCSKTPELNEQKRMETEKQFAAIAKKYNSKICGVLSSVIYVPVDSLGSTDSTRLGFTDGRIIFLNGLQPGIVFQLRKHNSLTYNTTSKKAEKNDILEKCE